MSDMIKIAVDAMGGDGSPKKVIDGIILNHENNKNNFYKIFGDKNRIFELINKKISNDYYEIIDTDKTVKKAIDEIPNTYQFKLIDYKLLALT